MRAVAPLGLLLLGGCAALGGQKAAIEDRYQTYAPPTREADKVTLSVSTSEVAATPGGVSITALSDRGQAALIEQTKGKPPTTIKPAGGASPAVVLRNSISRHLVIAIQPEGFLPPGDRVDAIKVSLSVYPNRPDRWQVSTWTQASNGQTVIDLGKLTDTSTSKATISTGLNIAKFLPNLTVTGENDQTSAREVEIKDTTDFDAAVDNNGVAWLYETAGWRQSLAHNLSVDVVLSTDRLKLRSSPIASVSDLSIDDAKGKSSPATPAQVKLIPGSLYSPIDFEGEPVCGRATLGYRIRHITNGGGNTFSESDDAVEFRTGTTEIPFLFSPSPYEPGYVIGIGPHTLAYEIGAGKPVPLVFATLDEATDFRNWLRQAAPAGGKLANGTIGFIVPAPKKYRPLSPAEYAQLMPGPQDEGRESDAPAAACTIPPAGQ